MRSVKKQILAAHFGRTFVSPFEDWHTKHSGFTFFSHLLTPLWFICLKDKLLSNFFWRIISFKFLHSNRKLYFARTFFCVEDFEIISISIVTQSPTWCGQYKRDGETEAKGHVYPRTHICRSLFCQFWSNQTTTRKILTLFNGSVGKLSLKSSIEYVFST